MKTTKAALALLLVLTLLLSLGSSAFAAEAQFKNTSEFVTEVGAIDGFTCEPGEITTDASGNRYETVWLTYAGGEYSDYTSRIFILFSEDCSDVEFRMYNLIRFDAKDFDAVLNKVNDINAQGTGVKLYVDTSDNSVTAELYLMTTEDAFLDISATGLGYMLAYTDSAFEQLNSFNLA